MTVHKLLPIALLFLSAGILSAGDANTETVSFEQKYSTFSPPELEMKKFDRYLYFETTSLIQQKKYEEALLRLRWFWDHILEYERAQYGVRLSFALGIWKQLADVYPPALQELRSLRDKSEQGAAASPYAFHDLLSLNETLGETPKSIAFFKELMTKSPEQAQKFYRFIDSKMIAAKEFKIAMEYGGSPADRWEKLKPSVQQDVSEAQARAILRYRYKETIPVQEIKKYRLQMINYAETMKVAPLLAFANGVGDKTMADRIQRESDEIFAKVKAECR